MSDQATAAGTVKSADRVLLVFELLSSWDRDMSHTEIAEALQIPKSSLTQLLKNLVSRKWLAYEPQGKTYALGPAFTRLAKQAGLARDLVTVSGPVLTELTAKTLESSALNLLRGDIVEVACTVMGPQRLVSHLKLGDAAPLYATSGAKAILAHLTKDIQDDYIRRISFESRTPSTIKTAGALRKNLAKIVAQGFAYSYEEWTPGIIGVAKPILDEAMRPVGAVNLAIPAVRFNPDAAKLFEAALTSAVDAIRRQIALA
ncbi:IclR family transcriptional regulator [Acidisoma cladoniae]|jgi:DNA-binding IclR family transcriptional regulator|uniref:IclR family transcriptional regulator n=1 Tax=Acidisoma cladoniae TaxID=3040935 RepID=UPI002550D36B|nr:IclR family transcriptional regulator [Acidisoma sp. PAMC 29798]